MAAHESPAAVHDHIAADFLRERATRLVAEYDAHHAVLDGDDPHGCRMDRAAWLAWEGRASNVLREVARG